MVPIFGALVLQAMYGAVDLIIVGWFGTTAGISAVSTGSNLVNLVVFTVTGLSLGITVLISRYIGEKKQERIGKVIGGVIWFCDTGSDSYFNRFASGDSCKINAGTGGGSYQLLFSYMGYFNGKGKRLCHRGRRFWSDYLRVSSRMHPSRRLVGTDSDRVLELFCAVFILWYSGERKNMNLTSF